MSTGWFFTALLIKLNKCTGKCLLCWHILGILKSDVLPLPQHFLFTMDDGRPRRQLQTLLQYGRTEFEKQLCRFLEVSTSYQTFFENPLTLPPFQMAHFGSLISERLCSLATLIHHRLYSKNKKRRTGVIHLYRILRYRIKYFATIDVNYFDFIRTIF